jgi:hypothetical protein
MKRSGTKKRNRILRSRKGNQAEAEFISDIVIKSDLKLIKIHGILGRGTRYTSCLKLNGIVLPNILRRLNLKTVLAVVKLIDRRLTARGKSIQIEFDDGDK